MKFQQKRKNGIGIFWFVLFVGFLWLAGTPPVFGQSYRPFDWEIARVQQLTRWQIGPFRLSPTLNFRNVGYDSNIYREPEDDDPISDFTGIVSLDLTTYVLLKDRLILDFTVNPWYAYYSKTRAERSFNFNYSGGGKLNLLHKFILSGNYSYDRARRRASSEFDVRADQVRQNLSGSIFYETKRETSFGITTSLIYIAFEDEATPEQEIYLSRQLNRTEWNLSGEFYYNLRPETYFFVLGGYSDYTFDYEDSQWRDSYSYQSLVGVRFPILGSVRGTTSVGYKKFSPKVGIKKRFAGLIWETNVEARLNRINLRGQYNKDVEFSYWTNNVFFVEYRYGAGLSFYITQFIRLDYDYVSGDNRYPEEILIRLPDESYDLIDRKDKIHSHRVGAVFRILGNTGLGISMDFWERNSNDPSWGTRKSLFFGGYLTYDF